MPRKGFKQALLNPLGVLRVNLPYSLLTQYVLLASLLPAAVLAVVAWAAEPTLLVRFPANLTTLYPPLVFLFVIVGNLVYLWLGSALFYATSRIFGGKGKMLDSFNAVAISLLPLLLLGWVSLLNVFAWIYSLSLLVYGFSLKQKFSLARAAASIALPIILVLVAALASIYLAFPQLLASYSL